MSVQEVWMNHISVQPWGDPNVWTEYLGLAEEILGSKLTHVDTRDPIRRRAKSLKDAGEYIVKFAAMENSRWVFGSFEELGIEFTVKNHVEISDWPNSFTWHFPRSYPESQAGSEILRRLFTIGYDRLNPFYGYCDYVGFITEKSSTSGAIDLERELLGAFWLTQFCGAYVEFLGQRRFDSFVKLMSHSDGGVSLVLGATPEQTPLLARDDVENILGITSFASSHGQLQKREGQFALTFEKLKEWYRAQQA